MSFILDTPKKIGNIMVKHKKKENINMSSHINKEMSENEQMYLVTIAKLQEEGHESPVILSELANSLSVLPVSVNQMIHKMDESGLVEYYPYKGVEFTPSGRQLVMRILRYRRLWEVFLVQHLNMSLVDADSLACRMEHITPDDVANRLSIFLGNPGFCLHGYPIPQVDEEEITSVNLSLNQLTLGQQGHIIAINANEVTRAFLSDEGITPGTQFVLLAIGNSNAMLIEVDQGQVYLTENIARMISVQL